MIIAGPCLMDNVNKLACINTAQELAKIGTEYFRCKIWGGVTSPERWNAGLGDLGVAVLVECQKHLPVMTEVQTWDQIKMCATYGIGNVWIGARNSQNYGLLRKLKKFNGNVWIKRGASMTIDEVIGLYDIMADLMGHPVRMIERGVTIFDRTADSRWSPDLKGVIRIKNERPDIFGTMVVDCSHSAGKAEYIEDIYKAFRAIGVRDFMFEVWDDMKNATTDIKQAIDIKRLKKIIGKE